MTDEIDTFAEACAKADAAHADNSTSGKTGEPTPELTSEVIINLAGLTPLQYAQRLPREAKKYKTPVKLLNKAVEAIKIEKEAEKLLEPHWEVTPADDPVDATKLFADIEARILHHVAMPKHLAYVVALWVGQSWIHEQATYSPILFVTSAERDSGKSTLMGVIGFMVRRSLLSVGISAAALYRSIERWHPTFVIDEADDAFVDNPDLRQVVNSGWTRGQGVVRCDPDTNEPRKFSTFCPKAIAGKGTKAPDTIMSRAILITQKRRTRDEPIAHFNHVDDDGFIRLRSQLARWAADNGEMLGLARPAMPDGFMNRSASNWQLLFAIAGSLGEEAGHRARAAAQQIVGVTDLTSAGVELLRDIKTMFARSTVEYLTSKAIVADLTADPEKRWAEWSRGKPITEKGVATLLHEFRIFSRDVGPRDERVKGYRKADFADVWERYLDNEKKAPPSDPDNFPRTRAPFCGHSDMASAQNLSPEQSEELTIYPPRSLGEAFRRYRRTNEWESKAPRTREDWWRCWRQIKPVFGDVNPRTVTLEDISAWRKTIEETISLREAHRCLKIWRAMWKVAAALGYCVRDADPGLGVRNRAAAGRDLQWSEGEVVRQAKRAWRMEYHGLAAVIAVAWDTQLSPGDVVALRASQLARGATEEAFFTERGKTGKPVGGILSTRALWALRGYLEKLGVELHGDAYIFRNRSGARYSVDTLGDDFRDVRSIEFGPLERRTLGHDFRRTGAVEAISGGAKAEQVAHAMGNTLSASNALFATYVPVNVTTLRDVMEARRRGRSKLR